MRQEVITFCVLLVISVVIITIPLLVLGYFGDKDRAVESGLQGLRWLLVGAVVASVADDFTGSSLIEVPIPFALALFTLTVCEYVIRREEAKAEAV